MWYFLCLVFTCCDQANLFAHAWSVLPLTRMQFMSMSDTASATKPRKKVLVLGGSGRVGGSTVRALHQYYGGVTGELELLVGGRNKANFETSIKRWERLRAAAGVVEVDYSQVQFVSVNLEDHDSLVKAMTGCDCVVHTAGPFQGREEAQALAAALEVGAQYVDVCDDSKVGEAAKKMMELAKSKGVSAIISAGIWPGVDQLMAVEACNMLGGSQEVDNIDFSAFTAGTGNAGTTILSATFLILAERALSFVKGKPVTYPPASDFKTVNFGPKLGDRLVFRMNLIEAVTCHECLKIPNIDTYFGTAPQFWNYLLKAITLLPQSILRNRDIMQGLAIFSEPIVRITDMLVGSANSMVVTATGKDGRKAVLSYGHDDLETCVGIATAAFAAAVMRGDVPSGVLYPEEAFAENSARQRLLLEATREAFMWERSLI